MKTKTNNNLLTKTIENINHMEYFDQTVRFIARVIEYSRNNITGKGASFSQSYFLHKGLKEFGQEGRDVLTKEMDQLDGKTFWAYIY